MKEFWNLRYNNLTFAYGKEPNEFLKDSLNKFNVGKKILFPAEGEGRNAVYAASNGFNVSAFDISQAGKEKSIILANEKKVSINYQVGPLPELDYQPYTFDTVALIFAHFSADIRSNYHAILSKLLKPSGYLFLEAFSKNHLKYQSENPEVGGPSNLDMLFSEEEIKNEFPDLEIIMLKETIVQLNEGDYHNGKGSVIRFIGKKKNTNDLSK